MDILGLTERKSRPEKLQVNESVRRKIKEIGFGYDYWDNPDFPGHQGYHYDGRWKSHVEKLLAHFPLPQGGSVLEVGCGKGYLLYELSLLRPDLKLKGLDVSDYAIQNSKPEIKESLVLGDARELPFQDKEFDLVISLATIYFLDEPGAEKALREIERVGKKSLVQMVTFRNETEKQNMLKLDLGNTHKSIDEWKELAQRIHFTGEFSWFIFV